MKDLLKKLWRDESAQGMSEYMLLLVIVVGILITFRGRIQEIVNNKMGQLEGDIGGFGTN